MTSNQIIQQAIIIGAPVALSVAYISYKEKRFKLVVESLFTFALQYGFVFGTFYLLTTKTDFILTPDIALTYLLSGIFGLIAILSRSKLFELCVVTTFSTIISVALLPKELIIIVATGVFSALFAALAVRGFKTVISKWINK